MAKIKKTKNTEDIILTQKGYNDLVQELNERIALRAVLAEEIKDAKDLGDLSENASYQEAMERKDLNESRIEELEVLIARGNVIEQSQHDKVVTLGRIVEIKHQGNNLKRIVQLVGSTEADPLKDKISIESPLGKSLLNAHLGQTITIKLPTETVDYNIIRFVD